MSRAPVILNKEACLERLTHQGEYLGIAEIATVLGISKQVTVTWMNKGKLPEPHTKLAMGTIWSREQILEYLMQLPDGEDGDDKEDDKQPEETTT